MPPLTSGERSLSLSQLSAMVRVQNDRGSQFVVVEVRDSTPKRAAHLATLIAQEARVQFLAAEVDGTQTQFVQDEINSLATEIKRLEASITQGPAATNATSQADRLTELNGLRQLYDQMITSYA